MSINRKSTKAMALLYVIVTVGVLSLSFISITEIGKSRALQAITAQSKSKAYEALDTMMECAMGADRSDEGELGGSVMCGDVTVTVLDGDVQYNSQTTDYDMLIGKFKPNSSACAQAILYRIATSPANLAIIPASGNKTIMIVRGFSSCKLEGGSYVPAVKDPNFSTVMEKVSYIDFPL